MKNGFKSFREIKKANCHLHITGALKASDLRYLAHISKVDISSYEPLEEKYLFQDPTIWAIAKYLTSIPKGLSEAIKIILKREAEDNVVYVELTINPAGMIRRGISINEINEAIQEGFKYGESLGIKSMVKFGVNRKDGPDSVIDVKNTFNSMSNTLKICIDLNGDEKQFKTLDFVKSFKQLLAEGIPVSIHAGEYSNLSNSLEEAMMIGPSRLAHAIAITENENLFEKLIKTNVIIEVCPISNIKTGAVTDIKNHPVSKFIEHGIPIIFGSDDPAFFETNLSSELECLKDIGIVESKILELNEKVFEIVNY